MTRTAAVGLGLVGLALAWMAYRGTIGARLHVPEPYAYLGAQKRRTTRPAAYEPWTVAQFLALPVVLQDYQTAEWATVRTYTARAIHLEGYVAEVIRQHDGDVHLHLRAEPSWSCFPLGPRGAPFVTEVTPPFQPPHTGWSDAALGDLCQRQRRVRLAGWLLHDFAHVGDVGRSRASGWEIHPVTAIEVWDAEHQTWRPWP
jgi:hypothetical protein